IKTDALGEDAPELQTLISNVAELKEQIGDYDSALFLWKRLEELYKHSFGEMHPNVADVLDHTCRCLQASGRFAESEDAAIKSLALREHTFGDEHPKVAASLCELGQLFFEQGKLEEAERNFKRALKMQLDILGDEHEHVAA